MLLPFHHGLYLLITKVDRQSKCQNQNVSSEHKSRGYSNCHCATFYAKKIRSETGCVLTCYVSASLLESGCCMADDASEGVVDHRCRVFQNKAGKEIHKVSTRFKTVHSFLDRIYFKGFDLNRSG